MLTRNLFATINKCQFTLEHTLRDFDAHFHNQIADLRPKINSRSCKFINFDIQAVDSINKIQQKRKFLMYFQVNLAYKVAMAMYNINKSLKCVYVLGLK